VEIGAIGGFVGARNAQTPRPSCERVRAGVLLALLVAGALLAGCSKPHASPPAAEPFDGEAALAAVKAFALEGNGTPRYRIPGTAGQAEGLAHLWDAMDVPGWERHRQDLNGSQYLALDRSMVAGYGAGSSSCPKEWEEKVPSLPFTNAWAVRRGTAQAEAGAGLVLLAAHWDSQPESNYDPDPSRRHLPDPGANDGASGVGVLLELMHDLEGRGARLPFDVAVLFLDGEDGFYACYPLAGSLFFAQNPPEPLRAFVLLDMVGDAGARFPREAYSRGSALAILDVLWAHGQERAPGAFVNDTRPILDDHVAFIQRKVPSVDIIDLARRDSPTDGFPPQWDTSGDTVDKLSADMLGKVGQTLVDALQDPAFAAALG
jgi:hypothetical protein